MLTLGLKRMEPSSCTFYTSEHIYSLLKSGIEYLSLVISLSLWNLQDHHIVEVTQSLGIFAVEIGCKLLRFMGPT